MKRVQVKETLFDAPEVLPHASDKTIKRGRSAPPPPSPERPPSPKAVAKIERGPVPSEPRNMLSIIASAAANPAVNTEKMKELLAMQLQLEQAEQAREFNAAMIRAKDEMPAIVMDGINKHTKSPYATLENVSKEIDTIARRHGFGMSFGTDNSTLVNHYRIVCDLMHTGAHTRRYHVDLPADTVGPNGTSNKTPVQGVGSTISYARRYLKVMMFDLLIVGEDNDGNRPPRQRATGATVDGDTMITPEQVKILNGAINFCGVGMAKFCQYYGIDHVANLPSGRYSEALDACKKFKPKKEIVDG